MRVSGVYPEGLKAGDFIQTTDHCGDIFFEVQSCFAPTATSSSWMIVYVTYDKYSNKPRTSWANSATQIRKVIPAEMAIPTIMKKNCRFKAAIGKYDPFNGFTAAD